MHPFPNSIPCSARAFLKPLGFAFLLAAAAPARAQEPVVFGDTIDAPGVYFLAGNQSGSGTGITIKSDDVILLLTRFTLRGNGTQSGVSFEGRRNVEIYGGRITNFCIGIEMFESESCVVQGVRLDHCEESGVDARDVDDSWFVRLRLDHNAEHGLRADGCNENRIVSVLSSDNRRDGIRLGLYQDLGSDENKLRLCWSAYNGNDGIRVLDSDDNELSRNQCVGNDAAGIHLDGDEALVLLGGPDGADDNFLRSNWCVFNAEGIAVEDGSTTNELTNNTALANSDADMSDENPEPPCANNWYLNFFLFKDGAGEDCIF